MCGIFGVCYNPLATISARETRTILDHLFKYSQSRGKEASGLLLKSGLDTEIYKDTVSGDRFIKTDYYKNLFKKINARNEASTMLMGHARLDTNGSKWDNTNNSPLEYRGAYGIHNGIITNVERLWESNPQLERHHVVDSEVLLALFSERIGNGKDEGTALKEIFSLVEGSASVAIFSREKNSLSLATNTGSLYFTEYGSSLFVFASESYILEQLHKKNAFLKRYKPAKMYQILPKTSLVIDLARISHQPYQGRVVHAIL